MKAKTSTIRLQFAFAVYFVDLHAYASAVQLFWSYTRNNLNFRLSHESENFWRFYRLFFVVVRVREHVRTKCASKFIRFEVIAIICEITNRY